MAPSAIINGAPLPTSPQKTTAVSSTQPIITASSVDNGLRPQPADGSVPAWVKPDLTKLLKVEHLPGSFASRSISLVDLPAGSIFARITSPTASTCAYTSVQASRNLHIELNSDLVYINHSCRPTLVFDMARWEVRVDSNLEGGLKAGDELTFFYPSSEWNMSQPFDCLCKQKECQGKISGAKDMSEEILSKYWLNQHIVELLEERKAGAKDNAVTN